MKSSPNRDYTTKRYFAWLKVFLCIVLIILIGKGVLPVLALNRQMVYVLHIGMTNEDVSISYSSKVEAIFKNLTTYHAYYPDQVGSALVMLAIWLDNPGEAYRWLQTYPSAWEHITYPDSQWRTLTMLSYEQINGWNTSRRSVAYAAWMNGFKALSEKDYSLAIRWFRRGFVIAPGRVPQDVSLGYYQALSEWYRSSSDDDRQLAWEFGCLAGKQSGCLALSDNVNQGESRQTWYLASPGGMGDYLSSDGWRLAGFELDRNVLVAGIEVQGWMQWERMVNGHKQENREPFSSSNFVPNPGFEFNNLFADACVDGYIGSHAYSEPCASKLATDPYGIRPGKIAITESIHKGYALLSSSFPVQGGSTYAVGGWFCADNGATAALGWDSLTDGIPNNCRLSDGASICWIIWENSAVDAGSCWSPQLQLVKVPVGTQEIRILLQREGEEGDTPGRAMFDDLFIFELPISP